MSVELDFRDIEAFVTVVDESSFTGAARRLGVNQSVISTRIAHLESVLGIRLIDRGARRSVPTPAGMAAMPRARALLDGCTALAAEARRLGDLPEGRLTIAASTVPGTFYLPRVLAELRRQAPRLLVEMKMSDSTSALQELRDGSVELAVVGQHVVDDDVVSERIWTDSVVLTATREIAALAKNGTGIREIPLIIRRDGSATLRAALEAIGQAGTREADLQIAFVAADNEVAREAALAGLGAALLSERAAEREVSAGRLTRLDRVLPPVVRDLELVTIRGRTLSPGARLLAELLRNAAR